MSLKATIERLDGDQARIRFSDGQVLTIPISSIHGTPKQDGEIRIICSTGTADQPETQDLARSLLNELIGDK